MTGLGGQQFGKYILLSRIAQGGMAELYRAKLLGYEGFEKLVAIKKILPYLADDASLVKAFIDEAKLAAFLQHPNIVQIYDFGSVNSIYYIAMEYLYGNDLKFITHQYKEKGLTLSLENSLYIATQVCAGLDYAHKLKDFQGQPLNIIHRDIGPHNIFITYDGQVKIIDFGIAKAATQADKTQYGAIKGKIAYMSPEQARAEQIDHRSDIFAMGILLYEMVTHERVFDGDNTYGIFSKVLEAEYIPPGEVNEDLPPALCNIIDKALKQDREERYQTAEEMLADLESLMHQLSIITSYRNLALYMKELFGAETGNEADASEMNTGIDSTLKIDPDFESTLVLEDEEPPSSTKKMMPKFAISVFILISSIFILLIIINRHEPVIDTLTSYFHSGDFSDEQVSDKFSENSSAGERNTDAMTEQDNAVVLKRLSGSDDLYQPDQSVKDSPRVKEGIGLLGMKKYAEATALFEDILATDPGDGERVLALYSQALVGKASMILEKTPEKAKELLLKAVKLRPENPQGHYLLGRIYTQQKDYTSAIAAYQAAIELDPQMYNAYFNMGYIYAVKKEYSRAQEMFKRVIALSPPFVDEAFYNLAVVQRKMGNLEDCIKNLEQAITVNPENKPAKKLLRALKK